MFSAESPLSFLSFFHFTFLLPSTSHQKQRRRRISFCCLCVYVSVQQLLMGQLNRGAAAHVWQDEGDYLIDELFPAGMYGKRRATELILVQT
jgi:hypothetical protein